MARYERQVDSLLQRAIGETQVDLDGEHVRTGETNLGDFVADVMRQTAGAEAAIINGGTIRTGIAQGKIAVKDIYAVLPYDNYLVAISLTGAQVKAALEHGVARLEERPAASPRSRGSPLPTAAAPRRAPGLKTSRSAAGLWTPERVRGGYQ